MDKMQMQKLSDESLDMVTGGTAREMMELGKELGTDNLKEIKTGLKKKGIKANLITKGENEYKDIEGNSITHDDVLNMLKNS